MDLVPSAILAQLDFLTGSNIPPLPEPPIIERFLLMNPWPVAVVLAILAVGVLFFLNNRGRIKQGFLIAIGILAISGGAVLLAAIVETDREHLQARTAELVRAVAEVDRPSLESILAEDLSIRVFRVSRDADKEQVIAQVESQIGGLYRVSDYTVLDLQATLDGPRVGRTQTRLRVGSDLGEVPSTWRIDWVHQRDGIWRANRIEALWIPGIPNPGG